MIKQSFGKKNIKCHSNSKKGGTTTLVKREGENMIAKLHVYVGALSLQGEK